MYTQVGYLSDSRNWTLQDVNSEQVKILIPSLVYTIFSMIIGVVGNSVVLFVYYTRFKPSNHRCFILMLAFCDVITCSVGMPFLIADMIYPYMFTNIPACRILRFINYLTSCVSICTLFLIAIERHRKICRPLATQISVSLAKRLLFLFSFTVGAAMAVPSLFMYGHNSIYTGVGDIYGVQCFTDDSVKNTIFPAVYNLVLMFLILTFGSGIAYCYGRIAQQRYFRSSRKQKNPKSILASMTSRFLLQPNAISITKCENNHSSVKETFYLSESSEDIQAEHTEIKESQEKYNEVQLVQVEVNESNVTQAQHDTFEDSQDEYSNIGVIQVAHKKHNASKLEPKRKLHTHFVKRCETMSAKLSKWKERSDLRITKMLFITTSVYTLSFVPHFVLMINIFLDETFLTSMNFAEASIYQVLLRSFLINSVANPIIYTYFDTKFKKVCSSFNFGNRI